MDNRRNQRGRNKPSHHQRYQSNSGRVHQPSERQASAHIEINKGSNDDPNRFRNTNSTVGSSSVSSQSSSATSSPQVNRSQNRELYKKTYNTPGTTLSQKQQEIRTSQQHSSRYQQQQQQQTSQPAKIKTELDLEADSLYSDVQCSIMRGIDSTYSMPLSEHVLYSSYESYDNIMIEQRNTLNEMMSQLSECTDKSLMSQTYSSGPMAPLVSTDSRSRIDFNRIENLRDKIDEIREFSEQMFDRIGHNLDDAEGRLSRDAQLIQATLEAANHNKLIPTLSSSYSAHQQLNTTQVNKQENLSSSSSSSSLTRPSEINCPASFISQNPQHDYDMQQQRFNQQKFNRNLSQQAVNNHVQSNNYSHNPMRGQYGGYLGKKYSSPNQRFAMLENKNIPRPQDQFDSKIDNSYRPFEPIIKEKPNANVPLNLDMERDEHGHEYYAHPYEYEIQQFQIDSDILVYRDPLEPRDINSTPILKVETIHELNVMCQHIEAQTEFAVDVEHHSYRTYQGLTCLLQISTRTRDFVIDAIKLRGDLYRLNRSFTNPNIVKVFHGADCDILWLQRDFGVYVVNLFDTSRAAKMMKFAHLSLAFLMKHYCNIDPDKSYQLADWRERPLPLPMLQYARSDTHYLLYIYDRLRNDLILKESESKGLGTEALRAVFRIGKEICLKRYEKPPFSEKSHLSILRKSRSTFTPRQMYALKELYAWRDSISRELDESVGYVLPNNLMIRIAQYLPREPQAITAICNPVPPTLKRFLSDVQAIILKAIDAPLDETAKVMTDNPMNTNPAYQSVDLDAIGHRQDIAHSAGVHENSVPALLDRLYQLNCTRDGEEVSDNSYYNSYYRTNTQHASRLYNFFDTSYKEHGMTQGRR